MAWIKNIGRRYSMYSRYHVCPPGMEPQRTYLLVGLRIYSSILARANNHLNFIRPNISLEIICTGTHDKLFTLRTHLCRRRVKKTFPPVDFTAEINPQTEITIFTVLLLLTIAELATTLSLDWDLGLLPHTWPLHQPPPPFTDLT